MACWLATCRRCGLLVGNLQTLWLDVRMRCRLATCKCCGLLVGNLQALWLDVGVASVKQLQKQAGDARVLAQQRLQVCSLQALWLAGWQPAGAMAGCEACKGHATAENAGDARVLAQQRLQVGSLQALWLAEWQPAGAMAGCEGCQGKATAENVGDARVLAQQQRLQVGNLQALWLDVRVARVQQLQNMLGMQGSWRNKGGRLATCRRCGLQVGNLQALWLAGWQPAGNCRKCWGCKGLGATKLDVRVARLQATAENAGDARVLAQQRLQVGNLQPLWLDVRVAR